MSISAFDFSKSERLPGDVAQRFSRWLRSACTIAGKNFARSLPFAVELSLQGTETAFPRELLERIPEAAVAYRLSVSQEKIPALFVLPRPLVLALVSGVVGSTVTALPEDRELTVVEETLHEYFLNQLLFPPFKETWPGAEALAVDVLRKDENPRWTRLFPPNEAIVAFSFQWKGPFGEQAGHWLLPKKWLLSQGETAAPPEKPTTGPEPLSRPYLEANLRPLHLDVSVVLGFTELRLSQLAQLRPGDVLILDQKISLPVVGRVAGKEKFRGWPGKKGTRQQFQIESFTDA